MQEQDIHDKKRSRGMCEEPRLPRAMGGFRKIPRQASTRNREILDQRDDKSKKARYVGIKGGTDSHGRLTMCESWRVLFEIIKTVINQEVLK